MDQAAIREKVVGALSTSLAIPPAEITPESRLVTDLGMDSLDFLDITFALESDFKVTLRDDDFNRMLRPDRSEAAAAGEFLSAEEIAALAEFLPAGMDRSQPVPRRSLFSYITVNSLVRLVDRKLHSA